MKINGNAKEDWRGLTFHRTACQGSFGERPDFISK